MEINSEPLLTCIKDNTEQKIRFGRYGNIHVSVPFVKQLFD